MSNKRVIAVDCDDVILKSIPVIVEWYNQTFGTQVQLANYYNDDGKGWGTDDGNLILHRLNGYIASDDFMAEAPMQDAIETLRWLAKEHELHMVTGRTDLSIESTRLWVEKYFGDEVFTSLQFTNFGMAPDMGFKQRSKAEVCKELGVELLIDDHLRHVKIVAAEGIPAVLFGEYPWNAADVLPIGVVRLKDWTQVREYVESGF